MNGLLNILVAVAVVALVVARQFKPKKLDTERRVWILPVVLAFMALRDPHLIDPAHPVPAVALLVAGILVEIALGCVWGWTVRVWRAADGSLWTQGSKAAFAAWVGMLVLRGGLYLLAAAMGVHQGSNELLLTLAALLLVRGLVVGWRAGRFEASHGVGVAA